MDFWTEYVFIRTPIVVRVRIQIRLAHVHNYLLAGNEGDQRRNKALVWRQDVKEWWEDIFVKKKNECC